MEAKRFVLQWLYENKTAKIGEVHRGVYHALREKFKLQSKLAQDCYRDAMATYKGWVKNPRRGRFPRVKNISVWLTPKASYAVDLQGKKAKILGQEVEIMGYPHNLGFYKDWKVKEARLVKRDDGWYLYVIVKKKVDEVKEVKGLVAVDINMDSIVLGNDEQVMSIPTRLGDAYHFKKLAEDLQGKYSRRWRENERISNRRKRLYMRARNILTDFAKKASKWVIDDAKRLNADVIVLERLNGMIFRVKELRKSYRGKLYLMQYSRMQHWIEWQATKNGMKVMYVNASYSSTRCPYDGSKMEEVGHRAYRCPKCGYEDDRDHIAVKNLYGRGSLSPSTAPQMRGVNPNR